MTGDAPSGPRLVDLVAADGVRWRVVESALPRLFEGDRLLSAARVVGRTSLRETRSRRIERVDLGAERVLVKSYLDSPLEGLWRRVAGAAAAELEFENALELERRGFLVPEPLAFGRKVQGLALRESTLITRFVDDAVELVSLAQDRSLGRTARRDLIDALADLAGRLHAAGVTHDDLHLGNVLVDRSAPAPALVLIDLRRVRFGPPLDWAARTSALAMLGLAAFGLVSATERHRFLQRYLRTAPAPDDRKALARSIEAATRARATALARKRAASAVSGDSRFRAEPAGGVRWMVAVRARGPELARILEAPEAPRDVGGAFIVDRGMDPASAWRTLERSVLLGSLHVLATEIVAVGVGAPGGAYLVRSVIPDARTLLEALATPSEGVALARAAGRFVATLHDHEIGARSLSAGSFVVDARGALVLADLALPFVDQNVVDDEAKAELAVLAADLRRYGSADRDLPAALVEGYLERRKVADPEGFRRAIAR